jgi:acetylornithine deacetylase/succinyl-diaminopimelate desuccinylase-like protein
MSAPPGNSAERSGTRAERTAEAVRILAREPRPAGSSAEARAREYCTTRLRRAGFNVREEAFEYSAFVGRWGTAIGGLVTLAILLSALAAGWNGRPAFALAALTLGAAGLSLAARALARDGVLDLPAERRLGVNLIATREAATPPGPELRSSEPRLWLVAHLDSKSQPVPILVRAAGITLLGAVWIAGFVVESMQLVGRIDGAPWMWAGLGAAAIVAAAPVIATTVGARSPGALDNATGVATVLAAAEDAQGTHFGVCLTSGEELGLAGARAWVRRPARGTPPVAINCDSIDDHGATTCMYSGRRPDALVMTVLAAGSRAGSAIRAHRLLPGVLTDGVALADANWQVVTLSKGGIRTLARIHTPRDRSDALTGSGMDEVARVLVELIENRT